MFFVSILCILTYFINTNIVLATEDVSELRTKINGNRAEIQKIENEIKKYEQELNKVQGKKQTLQNSIYSLDLSRKKTIAKIKLTNDKISKTKKNILTLSKDVDNHVQKIKNGTAGLAQSLRIMNESDQESLIEILLKNNNLANAWTVIESLRQFQSTVGDRINTLNSIKLKLLKTKNAKELEIRTLDTEKDELASNKKALDINRQAKNTLLKQTKNKESEYQKILVAKRQAKKDFEAQMAAFEAKLSYILDKNKIPQKGSGIFSWPVPSHHITQYFGNTKFARSGAYNGRGHNGIDLRASIGTRVNSVLDGTVQDINNKVAAQCQYGKWVLIKHNNGLSTLYAHLSSISVTKGQTVVKGQRIGYSGNTGYAFGPHLHLTTYASGAVKFKQYKCHSGPTVKVPISAYGGYLNPIDYLQ